MSEVLFETRGNIAIITMNRPERRNALGKAIRDGLYDAWRRFEADSELRVAILTGAGPVFCAGGDLKEMAELKLKVPPKDMAPIIGQNIEVTKPVIAAVNGPAMAGGWAMAQMCDLCVASTTATFGVTEVKIGRGMTWVAPMIHMIPQRMMMEVLLMGEPITAQRAYEIGFVNRVVAPEALMSTALSMAETIAGHAPLVVQAAKEVVMLATEMGRGVSLRVAHHVFDRVNRSEDGQEGPKAFAEKRKPVWKGQ